MTNGTEAGRTEGGHWYRLVSTKSGRILLDLPNTVNSCHCQRPRQSHHGDLNAIFKSKAIVSAPISSQSILNWFPVNPGVAKASRLQIRLIANITSEKRGNGLSTEGCRLEM